MNILHLNTYDFGGAAKAAFRLFDGLRKSGHPSKMLVRKKQSSDPDIVSLEDIRSMLPRKKAANTLLPYQEQSDPDYYFFDRNTSPDEDISSIPKLLHFQVDIIIAHWISNFVNIEDLFLLQKITNAPIICNLLDMGAMTGGCHYAWKCKGYLNQCGHCPALHSDSFDDFSHRNLTLKKHFLQKMDISCVAGTEWLFRQAKTSALFGDKTVKKILAGVDQQLFRPVSKEYARKKLNLPLEKNILFFGAESFEQRRKGMSFFLKSLKHISKMQWISPQDTLLLSLGKKPPEQIIKSNLFPVLHADYISDRDDLLAFFYQAADVFVCPSIEDSGPLMINEAIMCGTPVVSFEMGVALDLVHTGKTGYRAPSENSEELAKGISSVLNASSEMLQILQNNCHTLALRLFTSNIQIQNFEAFFKEITLNSLIGSKKEELKKNIQGGENASLFANMQKTIQTVRQNTMLPHSRLESLFLQAVHCETHQLEGSFVECGVWKGGAVGLMAIVNLLYGSLPRNIHLFDSFQEICEPDASIDGERAIREVKSFSSEAGVSGNLQPIKGIYDSIGGPGTLAENQEFLENKIGYKKKFLHYHVGWFQDTLPRSIGEVGKIALLRIDGDWYASTKVCLDHLYDAVVPGGFIIIDDYGAYDGCRKAVDEFLKSRQLTPHIEWIDTTGIYWKKETHITKSSQAFTSSSPKLLNLGCGVRIHPEWVNVDFISRGSGVIEHDLRKGLPFESEEFDAAYHSHILEHFSKNEGKRLINECYRVLKPGGVLRVVVPDLENIVQEYLKWLDLAEKGAAGAEDNYDWILLELFDQIVRNISGGEMGRFLSSPDIPNRDYVMERIGEEFLPAPESARSSISLETSSENRNLSFDEIGKFRMGGEVHQWMYDHFSLSRLLAAAGFHEIQVKSAEESNIPYFSKYGMDFFHGKPRGKSSLFMEGRK